MAERVFAGKLQRAGFADVWVGGHQPFGIDQASLYPLFTPEVIQLMRQTIPADRQDHVATGVIVKARKPTLVGVCRSRTRRLALDGRVPQMVERTGGALGRMFVH